MAPPSYGETHIFSITAPYVAKELKREHSVVEMFGASGQSWKGDAEVSGGDRTIEFIHHTHTLSDTQGVMVRASCFLRLFARVSCLSAQSCTLVPPGISEHCCRWHHTVSL